MIIRRTKVFKKQYKKLPPQIQGRFDERLKLFLLNPHDPNLRLHALKGKYSGYWSINVAYDMRALFYQEGNHIIIFGFIGSHSQLYR